MSIGLSRRGGGSDHMEGEGSGGGEGHGGGDHRGARRLWSCCGLGHVM